MKQLNRGIYAAFLAVILATVMGCAENLPKESAGEYIDDAVITTKVKASIVDRPTLKVSEIRVETFKGTVYLSGAVSSQAQIEEAGDIARRISGVRAVKNELRLK